MRVDTTVDMGQWSLAHEQSALAPLLCHMCVVFIRTIEEGIHKCLCECMVVSGSYQNIYQNGTVSNQLTDVLGGGGGVYWRVTSICWYTIVTERKIWKIDLCSLHSLSVSANEIPAVFRILIYWFRIQIQHFRLNTNPDPDPEFG
jgi:hypothetical protein